MALLRTELKYLGVTNFLLRKIKPSPIVILQFCHVLTVSIFSNIFLIINNVFLIFVVNNEIHRKKKTARPIPPFLGYLLPHHDNQKHTTTSRYHSYLVIVLQFYVTVPLKVCVHISVWQGDSAVESSNCGKCFSTETQFFSKPH